MIQNERFAASMKRVLDEKQISLTELSRLMGYKSRNSIFRILNDQTSSEAESAFYQTLREKHCIELTEDQWASLEQALEISRVGYNAYCSNMAIRALVMGEEHAQENCLCVTIGGTDADVVWRSMEEALSIYMQGKTCEMVLSGGNNAMLIAMLARLADAVKDTCKVSIRHYFFGGEDEIAQNIMAIQPLLYNKSYTPFLLQPDSCSQEAETVLRATSLIIRGDMPDGTVQSEEFRMVDRELFCSQVIQNKAFGFLDMVVHRSNVMVSLLRNQFIVEDSTINDYLNYTSQYGLMEKNKSIYSIRPDIPVTYIHPDLLRDALLEGIKQTHLSGVHDSIALLRSMYTIHLDRWMNIFQKKKVTHTVLSRKGMEKFLRTGKQVDHFFAMRPYTVEERRKIMLFLREQAANNPYFSLYFLKEEPSRQLVKMALYEGIGLMLTKAGTDYRLEGDHAEVLLSHPMLLEKYKNYFMKELLVRHVHTPQETLAILDEMIHQLG